MTIEIKELTKRYKDHVAVDNLSLNIEKGEFFCITWSKCCGQDNNHKNAMRTCCTYKW